MISDVIEALAVEGFDHDGKSYLRLSGGVIPRVPRDVRDVSIYR